MSHSQVMAWLTAGLPITLLADLLPPDGPDSAAINCAERPAHDLLWSESTRVLVAGGYAERVAAAG